VVQITTLNAHEVETAAEGIQQAKDWFLRGLCQDSDPEQLFVEGHSAQKEARKMCFECPVRLECLADALDNGVNWGVWGGMTERERRSLLRRFPDVESWFPILRRIQDEQDARRRGAREKLTELWRSKLERENGSSETTCH